MLLLLPSSRARLIRSLSLLVLFLLSVGLMVLDRPLIPGDDAAITFRYAERLATGHGPTYNDHERVQGFSNPLQMLLLAGLHRLGVAVPSAALAIGATTYVATIWLAFLIGSRLAGAWGGWLAAAGLLSSGFFRHQCLGGMESGLGVVLGLASIACLGTGRERGAGVLLGLAAVNKLDAALLVLPLLAADWAIRRRPPVRTATIAAIVALPWFGFAWLYFGSPLPNSMIVKLTQHARGTVPRTWLLELLRRSAGLSLLLPASLPFLRWRGLDRGRQVEMAALAAWLTLHLLTFSLVDLGDAYPWYATVLFPPLFILAAAGVPAALAWRTIAPVNRWAVAGVAGVAFLVPVVRSARPTIEEIRHGVPIRAYEAFDLDRQLAGIFLDMYAEPDEVVTSGYGWVAYACRRPFNDATHLNTRRLLEPVAYVVVHGVPWATGSHAPAIPEGYEPVAMFDLASEISPGYTWFTVAALPTSSVYRRGIRFLATRLDQFPEMTPLGETLGLDVREVDGSIFAHAPSAFAFRFEPQDGLPRSFQVGAGFVRNADPRSDGVTFEVRVDGETRYRAHRRPGDGVEWIRVPIPADRVAEVALITEPGPAGNRDYDWSQWWAPELRVGAAAIDPTRIVGPRLREAWCERNPCQPVGTTPGPEAPPGGSD